MTAPRLDSPRHRNYVPAAEDTLLRWIQRHEDRKHAVRTEQLRLGYNRRRLGPDEWPRLGRK